MWALLGLIAFAALAWFCVARHVPLLESRLQASAVSALPAGSAEAVNVSMNGYTAQVSGAISDPQAKNTLIAAVQSVPGIRRVSDQLELVAAPVSATVDNNSQSDNVVIPADSASSTDEAPEALEVAEIAAPTEATEEAAPTVTLEPAELNLVVNERSLNITGRVQDQRSLRPVIETFMTTFDLNYINNDVETSSAIEPAEWLQGLASSIPAMEAMQAASVDIFDNQITVSGTVASVETEQALLNTLRDNLTNYTVVDRIRVDASLASDNSPATTDSDQTTEPASTETNEAQNAADEAAELAKQEQIAAEAAAKKAAAEKAAAEQAAKEQEAAELQAKLDAEKIAAAAAVEKDREEEAATLAEQDPVGTAADALTTEFSNLADTRILFFSGNSVLTDDSRERLDTIADLLLDYPTVPVAIKGHTDSQGDETTNLSLSQLRANAVRDFLVARGISVFRLSSFGYGESLPIDSNDTPEGRAANRRIEFSFR